MYAENHHSPEKESFAWVPRDKDWLGFNKVGKGGKNYERHCYQLWFSTLTEARNGAEVLTGVVFPPFAKRFVNLTNSTL